MVHYQQCPICSSSDLREVVRVRDFTVSGETFWILECGQCGLRITQDVPGQEEIGRYYQSEDYISHSDTSKGLVNAAYQLVRRRSLIQKRRLVTRLTGRRQGSLLDYGSGTGAFLHAMEQHGWQISGLEPDPGARRRAAELYGLALQEPAALNSLPDGSQDAVTLWHVLEHVHDLKGCLRGLGRVLKREGVLVIAVPNYQCLDAGVYGSCWAGYDVPRHLYHFSPGAMEQLLKAHGFTLAGMMPMWFDSFYISLLSSRYRGDRLGWIRACWTGLRSNLHALRNRQYCSSLIYVARK